MEGGVTEGGDGWKGKVGMMMLMRGVRTFWEENLGCLFAFSDTGFRFSILEDCVCSFLERAVWKMDEIEGMTNEKYQDVSKEVLITSW